MAVVHWCLISFVMLPLSSQLLYEISLLFFCFTVYDVTRRDTFINLAEIWSKEIELYSTNQDCIKMLVGNKVDKVCFKEIFMLKFVMCVPRSPLWQVYLCYQPFLRKYFANSSRFTSTCMCFLSSLSSICMPVNYWVLAWHCFASFCWHNFSFRPPNQDLYGKSLFWWEMLYWYDSFHSRKMLYWSDLSFA